MMSRLFPPLAFVICGVGLGMVVSLPPRFVVAQSVSVQEEDAEPIDLSEDTAEKIKLAHTAVLTAQTTLQQEGKYVPAVRSKNAYAVFMGGLDAVADLESGRGVDPVTFAGLHTGMATDDIAPHLGSDDTGRLTYKGKLVRIYSVDRMKRLESRQAAVLGVSEGGRATPRSRP